MYPAIFLDRDGVIIENRADYVRAWQDVEIFQRALQALALPGLSRFRVVMVTNQPAVGKGMISRDEADAINHRLVEIIRGAGGQIDGVYLCPHTPADACNCRKPRPGLLLQAAAELNLDLSASIMVGDALTDVQAGRSAGVQQSVLVLTGRGSDQLRLPQAAETPNLPVFADLYEALTAWLAD